MGDGDKNGDKIITTRNGHKDWIREMATTIGDHKWQGGTATRMGKRKADEKGQLELRVKNGDKTVTKLCQRRNSNVHFEIGVWQPGYGGKQQRERKRQKVAIEKLKRINSAGEA